MSTPKLWSIIADIEPGELWWSQIAAKHGVTLTVVRAIAMAENPHAVRICDKCGGAGRGSTVQYKACREGVGSVTAEPQHDTNLPLAS